MQRLLDKLDTPLNISRAFEATAENGGKYYDPEMLYVECRHCGKPIVWEPGRTTWLLLRSRIKPHQIDEHCLILSDGCHECLPYASGFSMSIVRLAGLTTHDLAMLQKTAGRA